ncbi:MAG: hypothetical protein WCL50_05245 [Spirochaetota bacterium]
MLRARELIRKGAQVRDWIHVEDHNLAVLEILAKGKIVKRLPMVVGRYHSHPGEQAEFRNPAGDEEEKFQRVGVHPL